ERPHGAANMRIAGLDAALAENFKHNNGIAGDGGGRRNRAAHDDCVGITDSPVSDDLDVWAERTARLSRAPRHQSRPQVEGYLVMRDGSAGHGDRLEPVELVTHLLPLLPREEFSQRYRFVEGNAHGDAHS